MTNERLPVGTTAKRTEGNISAMNAAYRSGHVFLGRLDIPVIDIRHYLEDELDMHHASASFSTRLRMIKTQGHAKNQIIWVAKKPYNPINQALHVIDEWLVNLNKIGSLVQQDAIELSRPQVALDRCFSSRGEIISEGNTVWDGEWNKSVTGDCMKQFPIYSESRNIAGAPLSGDVFKCQLQTIESAVQSGVYDALNMSSHLQELKDIFPQGVCDYSKPDVGLPNDFRITRSNFPPLQKRLFTEAKLGQ